jgi:hypothetical protein
MRKLSWVLVAAVALAAGLAGAQELAPNTVWGEVPHGAANRVVNAVLLDSHGNAVATVRVGGGVFSFPNVTPGRYTVVLQGDDGQTLARSHVADLHGGATIRVHFADDALAGGPLHGGPGWTTTRLVAGSAAALGCGGFIAYHHWHHRHHHHHPPVSGSR